MKSRAQEALDYLINNFQFDTILDVGCGDGYHSIQFLKNNKKVTSTDILPSNSIDVVCGYYEKLQFKPHDITWCSHVLEHQLNVNQFLKKIRSETKLNGYVCITVPPLKHSIVGGHVSLWNAGILMYNLVLAGFNCKEARIKSINYNITVIAKADNFELPKLKYDKGDINRLADFLPDFCKEKFNGDISEYNW